MILETFVVGYAEETFVIQCGRWMYRIHVLCG